MRALAFSFGLCLASAGSAKRHGGVAGRSRRKLYRRGRRPICARWRANRRRLIRSRHMAQRRQHLRRLWLMTDPELKGGRSSSLQTGVFFASTTKKRGRFCASRVTYAANGQKPAVVLARNAQFQKSRVMSATENQPRQKKMDFFSVESARTQPEATDRHRQSPLRVHSNSPKKIAVLPQSGGETPKLVGRTLRRMYITCGDLPLQKKKSVSRGAGC